MVNVFDFSHHEKLKELLVLKETHWANVYVTSQEIVFNSTCYSLQSSTYKYYEVPDQFFFAEKREFK